jgi:hypothetical protein
MHLNSSDQFKSDTSKSSKGNSLSVIVSDIAALMAPSLTFIQINIGGTLFASEIVLLIALPLLIISRGKKLFSPMPRHFIILALVWLFAQMLTDVIRDTPIEDFSRGWARVVFFVTNFIAIYLLVHGSSKRMVLFIFGFAISQILSLLINPGPLFIAFPWKFGYGTTVTYLICLLTQLKFMANSPRIVAAIFAFIGILHIYHDSRGAGFSCFVVAIFIIARSIKPVEKKQLTYKKSNNGLSILVFTVVFLICINVFTQFYSSAVSSGLFGEDAREKYELQSRGQFGLLLGGRAEILSSSAAIFDSPIIGHGSWAKDDKYRAILEERLQDLDYGKTGESYNLETGLIPSHSYLLGAWVESGFFGTFIWFWLFTLTLKQVPLLYNDRLKHPVIPLIIFFSYNMLWGILFSPFGSTERLYVAFCATMVMSTHSEFQKLSGDQDKLKRLS